MERIRILIDTREQIPWAFDEADVDTTICTLRTGDYALEGDEGFGIERKSLDDFLGTISSGWPRFVRELNRMDEAGWAAKVIVVEGDYASITFRETDGELVPPAHRHWMLTPQFVEKRVAELTMRRVSVLFAKDASLAAGLAAAIFRQRRKELDERKNSNTPDPELQAGHPCRG